MSARAGALIARVLLDSPLPQLDRLFDYAIPESLAETAQPGVRVKVPLRSTGRSARGYIVEVVAETDFEGALAPLDEVVSSLPVLTPEVWALARRVADRAAGTASDVIRFAIPPRQVRVEKAYLARESRPTLKPVTAVDVPGYPADVMLRALREGHRLAVNAIPRLGATPEGSVGEWALTAARLACNTLADGKSAIIAVPDYRDQDQVERALRSVLPDERLVAWDARQSGPDRYRNFLRALDGDPVVIVGTRSTVYAPSNRLGLVLVWDDGDPLHAEPLAPYVATREAALVRQEQSGAALVFLSHTRSTDVQRLVEMGFVRSVEPSPRFLPKVVPTLFQHSEDPAAARARIPSSAFRGAHEALRVGPVLVQVARAGYAPSLRCGDCGEQARCAVCAGPLRLAHARDTPTCGWCGALASSWRCGQCDGTRLRMSASGSVRTAEELGRAFPGKRVIVSDGSRPLLRVSDAPALVVATRGAEPLAEGGYQAVLLLDGDRMLSRESLWVAEDSLREWSNVIALAAPGAPSFLVGVGGELATALVTWNQSAWAGRELAARRAVRFPPAVRVASVTGTLATVTAAIESVSAHVPTTGEPRVDVLGPITDQDGHSRAMLRFDYALGRAVADHLRAAVVRNASGRRRPPRGERTAAPVLRVHLDDREFLE